MLPYLPRSGERPRIAWSCLGKRPGKGDRLLTGGKNLHGGGPQTACAGRCWALCKVIGVGVGGRSELTEPERGTLQAVLQWRADPVPSEAVPHSWSRVGRRQLHIGESQPGQAGLGEESSGCEVLTLRWIFCRHLDGSGLAGSGSGLPMPPLPPLRRPTVALGTRLFLDTASWYLAV